MPARRDGVSLVNINMNRYLFVLFLSLGSITGNGQADSSLLVRLDSFFRVNHLKDIDRVLDFTYPKLFTIVPREQMAEVMKSTFDNDEMTVEMDSLQIRKYYPMITTTEGSFQKMDYSMILRMRFKESAADSTDTPDKMNQITSLLSAKYGEGNARYDAASRQIVILVMTPLIAIKDSLSPEWTFINFNKDETITSLLLSGDILNKLNNQQ